MEFLNSLRYCLSRNLARFAFVMVICRRPTSVPENNAADSSGLLLTRMTIPRILWAPALLAHRGGVNRIPLD
jgi:hypothetical protein